MQMEDYSNSTFARQMMNQMVNTSINTHLDSYFQNQIDSNIVQCQYTIQEG